MRCTTGLGFLTTLLLASCSLHSDVSEAILWPSAAEMVVPTDVGLDYEPVNLDTGPETSINGWFIPSAEADGRTVLFCHGNGINITFCHPYYQFLHEAGFNVFLFDYRGFGKSWGAVSMDSLLSDMAYVMDYLRSNPEVDPERIALYGVSIGTWPALRAAATYSGIVSVVVEDVISADEFEVPSVSAYFGIPWALDPQTSAAGVDEPLLYLTGANDKELGLQFRVFNAAKGPKTFWIIPGASSVPTSLLVQDREYQAAVSAFLEQCFEAGAPEFVSIEYRARQRGPQWAVQATLGRRGTTDTSPWPVEISLRHARGITFQRVWLEGEEQVFDLTVDGRPLGASAWRYRFVDGDPASETWKPDRTPLAKANEIHAALIPYVDRLREPNASVDSALEAEQAIENLEQPEPFSPVLEAELTELYTLVGTTLTESGDEEQKDRGRKWLERCIAAVPDEPKLHFWPDSNELVGFHHGDSVARASLALARFYAEDGRSEDAIRVLEAAARVAPGDQALEQKLEELRRRQD
jgi:pimeloyl-ACP methyl ester carboxylesterase